MSVVLMILDLFQQNDDYSWSLYFCEAFVHSFEFTIHRKEKDGDWYTYNALRTKTLKERIKIQRNIVSPSNSTRAMLLV